jgi:hypothetical protein
MIVFPRNNGLITPWDTQPQVWVDPRNYDGANSHAANGTALASVTNLGTLGSTFAQASGGAQPNIQNNIINGNPVFRFSGAQSMAMAPQAGLNYGGPMSILCVFNTPNANPAAIQRFVSYPGGWTWANLSNSMQFGMFGNGTYSLPGTPISNSTWYSTVGIYNGSSSTDFYVNGTKTTVAAALTMGVISGASLYFGSRDGTQHFITADVALLLVYFRALQAWEINGLNFYLKNRFNT